MQEYRELLAGLPFELKGLDDVGIVQEVDETGQTFADNARLKAERYCDLAGMLTLADDSGLEVDALGGEPGVNSRRWAGDDASDDQRNQALLKKLERVPEDSRQAHFRCAIAIARPGHETELVEGSCDGRINRAPSGVHGFGYDPIFFVPELGCTLGEAPPEVKNRVSHRARAATAARVVLEKLAREARCG